MRKIGLFLFVVLVSAGCNLSTSPPTEIPTFEPRSTETPVPLPPTPTGLFSLPPLPATNIPVTSVPLLGSTCQVYTTYSGADPNNLLSLRDAPTVTGLQVLKVPNNVVVLLIPGTTEVQADGYHWLNVMYVNPSQFRYMGWMARDSYSVNGVPDPTIATLRPAGTQSGC